MWDHGGRSKKLDQAQRIAVWHVIGPKEGKDRAVRSVSLGFRAHAFLVSLRAHKHPSSSWKGFEKDRWGKFALYSIVCEEVLNKLFFFLLYIII